MLGFGCFRLPIVALWLTRVKQACVEEARKLPQRLRGWSQ